MARAARKTAGKDMRILVTNDDGINAPGLKALEKIARKLSSDVWVVAPEEEQSGSSHSLSLANPIRLRELGPKKYAVKGTPSDCVMMAVRHILHGETPDLVLSGVNRGQNIADDVTYSGTPSEEPNLLLYILLQSLPFLLILGIAGTFFLFFAVNMSMVMGLAPEHRATLQEQVRHVFLSGKPDGFRSFLASAWICKGIVPETT